MHIGITGYAESGKDVVADILVEKFGFVKIGMSDALDRYLMILDPYVDLYLGLCMRKYSEIRMTDSYVEAKKIPEVRRLLQVLGTEVGRSMDPDIWVKELKKSAAEHINVVTTGIRFQNEFDAMDLVIWVDRGRGPLNDHESENLKDIFAQSHYKIENFGTIQDLEKAVVDWFYWYTNID